MAGWYPSSGCLGSKLYAWMGIIVRVLLLPLRVRHPPDRRHHERGEEGHHMDDNTVLRESPVDLLKVDEVLENLDERDARDGQGDLDLQDAGVYVVEPLRPLVLPGQLEPVDEDAVPALNHHHDQVGHHARVDEAKQHDHQGLHVPCEPVHDEAVIVNQEGHDIEGQGDYQRDVDRVQQPADGEDRVPRTPCPVELHPSSSSSNGVRHSSASRNASALALRTLTTRLATASTYLWSTSS